MYMAKSSCNFKNQSYCYFATSSRV